MWETPGYSTCCWTHGADGILVMLPAEHDLEPSTQLGCHTAVKWFSKELGRNLQEIHIPRKLKNSFMTLVSFIPWFCLILGNIYSTLISWGGKEGEWEEAQGPGSFFVASLFKSSSYGLDRILLPRIVSWKNLEAIEIQSWKEQKESIW